jgi:hypothetical protein
MLFQGYTVHVQITYKALVVEGINTVSYGTDMEPINVVYDMIYDTVALGE